MKKLFLFSMVFAGLSIPFTSQAQETISQVAGATRANTVTPEGRAKMITERINSIVKLSPEQYNKVLAINMESLQEQNGKEAVRADAAGLTARPVNNLMDKIKAVLTPAQIKLLDKSRSSENGSTQQLISPANQSPAK
ncbi:MAG: hypothetical protein IPP77_00555 [Bacteroidetes bacterium]|nr:hypothetical protein [Bacteroidota bacterium]